MGEHVGEYLPVPMLDSYINWNHGKDIRKLCEYILKNKDHHIYNDQNGGGVYICIFESSVYNCISHNEDLNRFSLQFKDFDFFSIINTYKERNMANSRRDKADSYTQRAHREGYPARSVYKLEEINQTHHLIKPGDSVLDVGAAPGSWTLYTHRELIKGKGRIVSVDLNPLNLNPVRPTVTAFVGDAFSKEIRQHLVELGPYDAIISDAAPMTTGNRTVDTTRSEWLAEQVVYLSQEQLKTHGNLVIKIFQGGGQEAILKTMRTLFQKAKAFKPKACRDDSFEIYLIGLDKK